ncbi:MAG TPA: A/G-specific adenine glycosylase [Flavobacteriales bacterium]
MSFSAKLLKWYDLHKRDLPWRHTVDPYKVWLSEIILQQTRVDQGMSYYLKFVSLFPTVNDLAAADEDQVLKAWQGLGYYSRARNLHATARQIATEMGGQFPEKQADLLQLKGVGQYTSAAIASFCFNEVTPVVDGNVSRVLSRLHGLTEPIDSQAGKRTLYECAWQCIDREQPGLYNQAIMEFGALQCVPVNPDCQGCPFKSQCVAYASDTVKDLPVKGKKTAVKKRWFYYFYITDNNGVYIKKRTQSGIWKGLHDFPLLEKENSQPIEEAVAEGFQLLRLPKSAVVKGVSEEYVHVLSHRKIHARFIAITLPSLWSKAPKDVLRIDKKDLASFGIPRLIDKFLESDILAQ